MEDRGLRYNLLDINYDGHLHVIILNLLTMYIYNYIKQNRMLKHS